MHPVIELPGTGIGIRSHTVMLALAIMVSSGLTYAWLVRQEQLDRRRVCWALVLIAGATLLGGRLHFVIANWERVRVLPWPYLVTSCGLHAPGAIFAAALSGVVVAPLLRLPLGRLADALAVAAGAGIAVARIGCLLHGCCFGTVCQLPWCVQYARATGVFNHQVDQGWLAPDAAASLPVHPLQLYFAGVALAITGLLLWLAPRRRYDGQLALVFLISFSGSSAALEFLRDQAFLQVGAGRIPPLLWVSSAMTLVSAVLLLGISYRQRRCGN